MKITLPLPENRANARWHWRTENRKKKTYFYECDILGIQSTPIRGKVRIRATLYLYSEMDTDNLMARLKWPVDWLVRRGFIEDDKPATLEWELPQQAIDRKNQRVEIELEAI